MYINVEEALVPGLRSSGQQVDPASNPPIVALVFPRETCIMGILSPNLEL